MDRQELLPGPTQGSYWAARRKEHGGWRCEAAPSSKLGWPEPLQQQSHQRQVWEHRGIHRLSQKRGT